ncbi:IclR family transcriptional regulator [Nocardioides pocheonensis]|uniref:IclR family transcriptional regulator n=1 Tax=Nocardioides pocheonensis TaxID=661485 RepID=A0A3N0GI94_9ACTN|nr:IclR family transcriptional regulator [Nocardioides pocheonensis]RNM12195.1 IclR family transcriptional regulator [Nocardioides pocheonensis]
MSVSQGREPSPAGEHRTVARVMSLLELVLASDPQGLRLGELSNAIDAPKSSVHGLTKGLVAIGYLREEDGRYIIGPAISTLLAVGPSSLPSMYRHAMEDLTERWDETTMLATLVGESLVYLDAVEPAAFIRAAPEVNKRLSLWPRSSGKCFVAFMDERKRNLYLRRNKEAPTDSPELRAELEEIRQTNLAKNVGGSHQGHLGIASPIHLGGGPVTIAIAIVGPLARMEDKLDQMSRDLVETVQSLSPSYQMNGSASGR